MKRFLIMLTYALLLSNAVASTADYEDLTWEDMIPADAIQPKQYTLEELHSLDRIMADEKAENSELVGRQVVPDLAGQKVKLPAYVVPLEQDEEKITTFLLVPYFGACIHVPPPPPNQIVFGTSKNGIKSELFDAVWAYGTMQIETVDSELAEAGYSMKVDKVELMDME